MKKKLNKSRLDRFLDVDGLKPKKKYSRKPKYKKDYNVHKENK